MSEEQWLFDIHICNGAQAFVESLPPREAKLR
jgi:hypothetical protein